MLPAVAAVALLGTVVVAGVAGGFGDGGQGSSTSAPPSVPATAAALVATTPTTVPVVKTTLALTLGEGSFGNDVTMVQTRLKELGFDPGPIDGQFGGLTRAAVWAFEKLVLQTPRDSATGRVTNDMWQRMQDPLVVLPRRPDAPSANHTEIYLPEQIVIFFIDDKPALISHMASGTGEEWCEEVTISPGEIGNEDGTEPLKKGECGVSTTPGGVFEFYRRVQGVRESALGGMWNPVYFNYGIAIHGALNVPLQPASHGCIRIPLKLSEYFQTAGHRRRQGVRLRRRRGARDLRRPGAPVQLAGPGLHDDDHPAADHDGRADHRPGDHAPGVDAAGDHDDGGAGRRPARRDDHDRPAGRLTGSGLGFADQDGDRGPAPRCPGCRSS